MESLLAYISKFFSDFLILLDGHMRIEYEISGYEVFIGIFLLVLILILSLKQTYENRSLKKKQKNHERELKNVFNGIKYVQNRLEDKDIALKKLLSKISLRNKRIAYLEHMPLKQLEKFLVNTHIIPSEEIFEKEIHKKPIK